MLSSSKGWLNSRSNSEFERLRADFLSRVSRADTWLTPANVQREHLVLHSKLYWKDHKLVVPNNSTLRQEVLQLCHDAPWAGHLGRDKTRELVELSFWWPTSTRDAVAYVNECHSCQRNKAVRRKPAGYPHPLAVPER